MLSGTPIEDMFALVEGHQGFVSPRADPQADLGQCSRESSEAEQFPQPIRLSPADRYLGLLFIIHAQLVRALEPGNDFADPIDVHQIGTMRPPKKIRV